MKITILALSLFLTSYAFACPQLGGTYISKQIYASSSVPYEDTIRVIQKSCKEIFMSKQHIDQYGPVLFTYFEYDLNPRRTTLVDVFHIVNGIQFQRFLKAPASGEIPVLVEMMTVRLKNSKVLQIRSEIYDRSMKVLKVWNRDYTKRD